MKTIGSFISIQIIFVAILCLCQRTVAFSAFCRNSQNQGIQWNRNASTKRNRSREGGRVLSMYLPKSNPGSQSGSKSAFGFSNSPGKTSTSVPLSRSVLVGSDTLPSFSTAHGLLSPETVMRMERNSILRHRSDAVNYFLDTYKSHGPLACLAMLSDPDVLPELTEAMREIS
mmetsp:Transcript_7634/g.13768  ORF Transcript_7634/g.13768 Transcript_7634/m.13768 type:complete len:172 (-) Transcript_7634:487-1002(-)